MDYETADGSQFSLREVWTDQYGKPTFSYTSVSAYVGGSAYVGKLDALLDKVDDADLLTCLEPVPPECIHPRTPDEVTIAPEFDSAKHYLKAPSFVYDDCRPGKTFVADCVLNEVTMLGRLKVHPHRNLVSYLGCVVKDNRITHISLEKYSSSLVAAVEHGVTVIEVERILNGVQAGMEHLHALGLAHNDITPENICLDALGEPIIIDFDGCLPFGGLLMKGASMEIDPHSGAPLSSKRNDLITGMISIQDFLLGTPVDLDRQEHEKVAPSSDSAD